MGDDLDRVLAKALEKGLDAIAITDHDEIEGAFEARRRAHERRLPLAVVPGTEVSSRDGHIGGLFVMKKIPKGLSAAETVDLIHAAGGIAVAHHPYSPRWLNSLLRVQLGCGDLIKSVPFDAIECTNAVPGSGVKYNIAAIDAMRKQHVSVAVTGGSDAHAALFVGKGKTYYGGNEGVLSLYNSLLLGFTRGAEGVLADPGKNILLPAFDAGHGPKCTAEHRKCELGASAKNKSTILLVLWPVYCVAFISTYHQYAL